MDATHDFRWLQLPSIAPPRPHSPAPALPLPRLHTLAASDLTSEEIEPSPFLSASFTMGVSRPTGVCTATLMSTLLYCRMKSFCQELLTPGTCK